MIACGTYQKLHTQSYKPTRKMEIEGFLPLGEKKVKGSFMGLRKMIFEGFLQGQNLSSHFTPETARHAICQLTEISVMLLQLTSRTVICEQQPISL